MKANSSKKVLIVSPYFPPHLGGVEFYVQNIASGLRKYFKWNIVIVTSNLKGKKVLVESRDGIKFYRLPILFKISNTPINPMWFFHIKKIIEKENPDVINAHIPVPFMGDIAALVKGNTPLVIMYHALSLYKENKSLISLFNIIAAVYSSIGKITLKKSNSIIVMVDMMRSSFSDDLKSKTHVVNNSIWSKDVLRKSKFTDNNKIVFIGSLEKTHSWKGLEQIIKAICLCIKKYDKDFNLYIIGDGDAKQTYVDLAKELGIVSNIHFCGAKFGAEKISILKNSSLLISYPTTSNDAFPTVFLEAWANCVPVISSDMSPINTILKHKKNGYLVAPNSPAALAKAINILFGNAPLRKEIIENSFKQVRLENLWDKNIKKIHNIFVDAIN